MRAEAQVSSSSAETTRMIKPTPVTLWKRPAYLPYVHSELRDVDILKAQRQLGFPLPEDFLQVLSVQNGGPIRFALPDSMGSMIAGIGPTFPSITNFDLTEAQDSVDFSLEGLIPFDGDGHWYYCLDYRDDDLNPSVAWIDVECNAQQRTAATFTEFLGMMELRLDREQVLQNVTGIADARQQLTRVFGAKFEGDISNIGIPHWTCRTGTDWHDCFWISPNEVARGYSGKDPAAFQFEGHALRFPELPAHTVILEAPDEKLEAYRDRLGKAGFDLISIEDAARSTSVSDH